MKSSDTLFLKASAAFYKDTSRKIEVIANENSCYGDMLIRSAITHSEKAAKCLQDFLKISTACFALTLTACQTSAVSTSLDCTPSTLRTALADIEQRYGKPQIVSTYRKGAMIAGTKHPSYHASCRAVDFHPPRGRYAETLSYLKANFDGGIGTYSGRMHHLHIDDGSKKIFHTVVR
jgi:uncharacterized protein YcbK (DUF882 family)